MTDRSISRSAIAAVVLLWLVASCGGSDSPMGTEGNGGGGNGGGGPGNGGGDRVSTTSVSVRDNFFEPANIAVSTGATVTWTWAGDVAHNVTWVGASLANSQTQVRGSHAVTMPATAGDLVYYCTIHGTSTAGMRGTIRVQ